MSSSEEASQGRPQNRWICTLWEIHCAQFVTCAIRFDVADPSQDQPPLLGLAVLTRVHRNT